MWKFHYIRRHVRRWLQVDMEYGYISALHRADDGEKLRTEARVAVAGHGR